MNAKAVAVLLGSGLLCLAQNVVWKEENPDAGYLIARIKQAPSVGVRQGRAIALNEINKRKDYRFVLVQVYSDQATLPCSLMVKGYHIGYVAWKMLYEDCVNALSGSLVEAITWRGGVYLRQKEARQAAKGELVSGSNPYLLRVGVRVAQIVFFSFPRASTERKESRAELYAVVDKGNETTPAEDWIPLYEEVVRSIPFEDLTLYLRADDWFILQEHFPIAFPFAEPGRSAPSEVDFLRTRTIVCYGGRERPRCGVQRN